MPLKHKGLGNLYVYFFKIYIKKWFVTWHTSPDLAALATKKKNHQDKKASLIIHVIKNVENKYVVLS